MPPQHVEIMETVIALRRKLRRDRDSGQTATPQFATNRGNKLRPGARYVHAGSLPYRHVKGYKEKVDHAGYHRYILERNPRRYNGYGDELEDSESDADADADAEEENAYGDVRVEELLRPLTHPSELASHPTMSQAYHDPALSEMVLATDAKIREERRNLWRAKNLYRHFTGDESWIPCEKVESHEDWDLFEPNPGWSGRLSGGGSPDKRRRLNGDQSSDDDIDMDIQIADAVDDNYRLAHDGIVNGTLHSLQDAAAQSMKDGSTPNHNPEQDAPAADVSMVEAQQSESQTNGVYKPEHPRQQSDKNQALQPDDPEQHIENREQLLTIHKDEPHSPTALDTPNHIPDDDENHADNEDDEDRPSTASTPPLPIRRITRALAAEAETNSNPQIASPPPTSPTISSDPLSPSSSLFTAHPMFLLPPHLTAQHAPHPSYPPLSSSLAHSGLPPEELLETRKLLSIFIQKSEETIRGLEGILGKLIKAKRRRDQVLEWCIAEAHVGEMSDGEDWIDAEQWGLTRAELRKGRDEDSGTVDAGNINNGGVEMLEEGAAQAVHMGGRKGKRRRGAKD